MRSSPSGIPVQHVMMTDVRVLAPGDRVTTALGYLLTAPQQEFPVISGNQVLGILARDDVVRAIQEHGGDVPISMVMQRDIKTVDSHEMLDGVIVSLSESKGGSCQ